MSFGPKRGCRHFYRRNCAECGRLFIGRDVRQVCCSHSCGTTRQHRRNNKSTPRTRNKRHVRRAVERTSDITPAYEAALRSRTRKCRLCSTYMTSKPGQPNSKHLDHVVPLNVGGTHTIGNVRIICRTCNLARPKDGSDYTGPVTLWAQVPDVMMPAPKPAPKVKPEARPPIMVTCGCGVQFERRNLNHQHCRDCLVRIGQQAAALRAGGVPWKEVAERVGYRNVGNLHGYAVRFGGMPRRAA